MLKDLDVYSGGGIRTEWAVGSKKILVFSLKEALLRDEWNIISPYDNTSMYAKEFLLPGEFLS